MQTILVNNQNFNIIDNDVSCVIDVWVQEGVTLSDAQKAAACTAGSILTTTRPILVYRDEDENLIMEWNTSESSPWEDSDGNKVVGYTHYRYWGVNGFIGGHYSNIYEF